MKQEPRLTERLWLMAGNDQQAVSELRSIMQTVLAAHSRETAPCMRKQLIREASQRRVQLWRRLNNKRN